MLELKVQQDELQPVLMSGVFRDLTGRKICEIVDNELTVATGSVADFTIEANLFTLMTPSRRRSLCFRLTSAGIEIDSIAHVSGGAFVISRDDALLAGNELHSAALYDLLIKDAPVAITLDTSLAKVDHSQTDFDHMKSAGMGHFTLEGGGISVTAAGAKIG